VVLDVVNQRYYVHKLQEDEVHVVEHQLIHLLDNPVDEEQHHQVVIAVDVVEVIVKLIRLYSSQSNRSSFSLSKK
jgi:hypothetical protein